MGPVWTTRLRRVVAGAAGVSGMLALPPGARPAAAQPIVGPPLPSLAARPQSEAGRRARAAVRDFEYSRRRLLPEDPGGSAPDRCDVHIGRLCYWDNNADSLVPPEPVAALRARTALLAELARAAASDSADDWVAGQQVRYLLELGRTADATRAAAGCRGTPWWCQAIAALAFHAGGDHQAAAAAHDSARALLPDAAARCAWDDVTLWLPPDAARAYRRLPCGGADRARYEARFWRLAQPFWSLPANDLRAELAARRTLARLYAVAPNPQILPWGDDLAESDVRYGVPVAWTVRRPSYGSAVEPSVVGYEPTPSYDFTPDARTLAAATLLARPVPAAVSGAGAWALRRPLAQTRYAPRYAALGVSALDHQLARFRRGDTLVVVGAYATRDSGAARGAPARRTAALVLDDTAGRPAAIHRRDDAPPAGALLAAVPAPGTAAGAPVWLASLEVLDTAAAPDTTRPAGHGSARTRWRPPGGPQRGRAARARTPVAPLAPDARLSDLLLVRPGDYGPAPTLAAVVDSAAGAPVIRAGELFGLYWEQYQRAVPAAAPPTVAITATRIGASAWERLGALVGRAVVAQPVSLRYADPVAPDAPPGRYVALRWPVVPPGTYRLAVTVTPATGRAAAAPAPAAGAPADSLRAGGLPADTVPADTSSAGASSAGANSADTAAAPTAPAIATSVVVRVVR